MKQTLKLLSITTLGIMTYILFGGSCLPKTTISVDGFLFGKQLKTTVDNSLASLMLTSPQDNKVLDLFALYKNKPLDTQISSYVRRE